MKKTILSMILTMILIPALAMTVYAEPKAPVKAELVGPDGTPAVTPVLSGATLTMLAPADEQSQMLSCLIDTADGKLIVVDGGLGTDAEKLKAQILARGGRVSAWLITHPHGDHAGALYTILENELNRRNLGLPPEITVEGYYYSFADADWYRKNDPADAEMALAMIHQFTQVDPALLHPVKKGDVFQVGSAWIEVLNNRYDASYDKGNNASMVYRVTLGNQRVLFLGDLANDGGRRLLADCGTDGLKAEIVQMAHHGQTGVSDDVYRAIAPKIALWNTPAWLYNSTLSKYNIRNTRQLITSLGARSYVTKDGDIVLK